MKAVLLIVVALAFSACGPDKGEFSADLNYIQDPNTGLCFAVAWVPYKGFMAHVPCTDRVMTQVKSGRWK